MYDYSGSMETQGCVKMLFLRKCTSEGCSGALTLPKQMTYESESTNHTGKELNEIPMTPKKKVLKKVFFCELTLGNVIQVKSTTCCTSRGELKTKF